MSDLCASIQHSIVNILLKKVSYAINNTGINEVAIAGGVSANSYLRKKIEILALEKKFNLYIPKFEYCTDNAAMIAIVGLKKFKKKEFNKLDFSVNPRWQLDKDAKFLKGAGVQL